MSSHLLTTAEVGDMVICSSTAIYAQGTQNYHRCGFNHTGLTKKGCRLGLGKSENYRIGALDGIIIRNDGVF